MQYGDTPSENLGIESMKMCDTVAAAFLSTMSVFFFS